MNINCDHCTKQPQTNIAHTDTFFQALFHAVSSNSGAMALYEGGENKGSLTSHIILQNWFWGPS